MKNVVLGVSSVEATADSLMSIFGFQPRHKVFAAKGDWFVAERVNEGWLVVSGPWPTSDAAAEAVPR